jgi:hypothetical protein
MKGHQSIRQRLILKGHHPLNWDYRKPIGSPTATRRHSEYTEQCDGVHQPTLLDISLKTIDHHNPFSKGTPESTQPRPPRHTTASRCNGCAIGDSFIEKIKESAFGLGTTTKI